MLDTYGYMSMYKSALLLPFSSEKEKKMCCTCLCPLDQMIQSCVLSVFPQHLKFNIKQINGLIFFLPNAYIHLNLIGIILAYWTADKLLL